MVKVTKWVSNVLRSLRGCECSGMKYWGKTHYLLTKNIIWCMGNVSKMQKMTHSRHRVMLSLVIYNP